MTPEELQQQTETLELINAELAGRFERQADSGTKIETKAIALVGYVLAAAAFLATQHPQPVLAGLAYAAYIAAFGLGVYSYAVGTYHEVPKPRKLLNGYVMRPKAEALAALAAERVKALEANASRHERKAQLWRISLACLALGVTLMVVSIVIHTGHHDSTARAHRSGASSASCSASPG